MFRSDPLLPPKARAIPLVLKNALSRVATSTEKIDRILKLYPKGTRHRALLPKFSRQCQIACSRTLSEFRSDPPSFPDQSVAGFSVVLAKENAAFDAFVKEEAAPRLSYMGRR